jgi:hypothetical protein
VTIASVMVLFPPLEVGAYYVPEAYRPWGVYENDYSFYDYSLWQMVGGGTYLACHGNPNGELTAPDNLVEKATIISCCFPKQVKTLNKLVSGKVMLPNCNHEIMTYAVLEQHFNAGWWDTIVTISMTDDVRDGYTPVQPSLSIANYVKED